MITDRLLVQTDPVWLAVTLTEFALVLVFLRPLEQRTTKGRARLVVDAVAAFALWYAVHLLHGGFCVDFCLNVAVLTVYVAVSRWASVQQALYVSCMFVLCTEVGKIVCVDFCMQPAYGYFAAMSPLATTLWWTVLSQVGALVCMLLISRWVFNGSIDRLTGVQSLFVLLPLVPYIYVRGNDYLYTMADEGIYWNLVWLTVLLSVTTILVVVGNAHNLSQQVEKNEVMRMQALLKEQHAQYRALKSADEATRRRYHDLKHYLNELEALVVAGDATGGGTEGALEGGGGRSADLETFAAKLREELKPYESQVETGNETLDVLLAEKRAECRERGVRPLFYVDARCLGFMSSFDLCAIFGNLLDNALEAAEKVADPRREIQLDVRPTRGMAVVRCRNPYEGRLSPSDNGKGFATTKADREEHGYGLRSVEKTVESYGGSVSIDTADGMFTVTVVVPVR